MTLENNQKPDKNQDSPEELYRQSQARELGGMAVTLFRALGKIPGWFVSFWKYASNGEKDAFMAGQADALNPPPEHDDK